MVAHEETYLERRFGDAYRDYKALSAAGCSLYTGHEVGERTAQTDLWI
jgi:hypothetical protein